MFNLLDAIYEYQLLIRKNRDMNIPLTEVEKARLVGLAQLLRGEYAHGSSGTRSVRMGRRVPVHFTVPGGFASGKLRNISPGGVAITTPHAVLKGSRTVLRVAEPRRGMEYTFPGRIVWTGAGKADSADPRVVGIAFDGTPTRSAFLVPEVGSWHPDVRFGEPPGTPMVA
ncbi:MAG: PilZ domain-containing protein [Myxococcota bacterium]